MTTTLGSDIGRRIRFGVAGEGIELDRKALRVPLDPLEVDADDLLHSLLSFTRRINQIPVAFDKQVQTIRLERLIDQRAFDLELSLYVVERGANFRSLTPWRRRIAARTCASTRLMKERYCRFGIVQVDQRPGSLRLSSNWIPPAHYPTPQRPFRHSQVVGRFSDRVGRRQARVIRLVEHRFLLNIIVPRCSTKQATRGGLREFRIDGKLPTSTTELSFVALWPRTGAIRNALCCNDLRRVPVRCILRPSTSAHRK